MRWRAVDPGGNVLGPAAPTPAAALRAVPVVSWPMSVEDGSGRRLGFADALGAGGARVAALLEGDRPVDLEALIRRTPAGTVDLPVERVELAAGVEASAGVDGPWLAAVDRRRVEARSSAVSAGRGEDLEAALHVVLLVASAPADATEDQRVAAGARLWLLAGAVASALGGEPDRFQAWGDLVTAGWWPVGPSGGRLVVSAAR